MSRDRSNRVRRRRYALTYFGSGGVPPTTSLTALDALRWNTVLLDGNVAEHCSNLTFVVVQTERGSDGRVHYQAYCEFKKAVALSEVKKIFGDRIHVEAARATSAANIRYCTKNDSRIEDHACRVSGQWGTPKRGGGVMMAAVRILNGDKVDDVVQDFPDVALLHMNKIENFVAYAKGKRTSVPKITILYGSTGCGKSQYCVKTFPNAYWVCPPDSRRVWFGHYVGQDVCIFDDFHDHWFMLTHLLRLFDSTPMMVAPKGSQVPFNSGHIVITSNVDPRDWYSGYKGKKAHKDALERRLQDFATVFDCTVVDTPTGMGRSQK